jgi:hypothetical protein
MLVPLDQAIPELRPKPQGRAGKGKANRPKRLPNAPKFLPEDLPGKSRKRFTCQRPQGDLNPCYRRERPMS